MPFASFADVDRKAEISRQSIKWMLPLPPAGKKRKESGARRLLATDEDKTNGSNGRFESGPGMIALEPTPRGGAGRFLIKPKPLPTQRRAAETFGAKRG
jgi:hypothetical protein